MTYSTNWLPRKFVCLAVFILFFLPRAHPCLSQTSEPAFPDPGHPGMSRDQQIKLGLESAAQVYKQMPVLPDNSIETRYVREIGKRLVATIPPEHTWPYQFHVVAQKEINAFALPGGEMFVNLGTMVGLGFVGSRVFEHEHAVSRTEPTPQGALLPIHS